MTEACLGVVYDGSLNALLHPLRQHSQPHVPLFKHYMYKLK